MIQLTKNLMLSADERNYIIGKPRKRAGEKGALQDLLKRHVEFQEYVKKAVPSLG